MEGIKGILKRKKDKGNENVPEESDDNPIRSILKKPKLAKRDENPVDDKRTDQVRQPDVMKTDGEHQIHKIAPSSELQTTTDAGEAKGTLSVEKDEHSFNKKSEKETVEKEMTDHKELKVDKNDRIGDVHKAQLSVKDKKSSAKEREKGSDRKSSKDKDQRQSKSHSKGSSGKSKGSKKSPSKKDGQKEKSKLVKLEEDVYEEIEPVNDPKVDRSRSCPYLDTINRSVLDFDFEKLCSVSLSHINVYACLVCGKYFQGRGKLSHAYTHSVQDSHHVYLNLQTHKFYCLPDNYEIIDSSLEDIIYVLNPTFTKDQITKMDFTSKLSRAYDKTTYLPGIVGLNNIKANDYCNVVLQALSHVSPLRDYFLQEENYKKIKRPPGDQMIMIVQRFGELLRKLWNPRNFKAHVSPHEMLQAVVLCSKKRFQITEQGDALEFLSWFLNALHAALNGSKKLNSSIINKTFRGKMKVYSHKVLPVDIGEKEKEELLQTGEYEETCEEIPWLYLTCDLPAAPLYPDEMRENIIPQVSFATILSKFNGVQEKEYKTYKDSTMKRFELTKLPPYIIVYIKRFTKNYFIQEKNRTIVNFPIKNIDFGDLLSPEVRAQHKHTVYDLMANIVHDGEPGPGKGTYRCHVLYKGANKWFEMQDLHVTDILPQMITLSESYIQIFELRRDIPNSTYNSKEAEKPVSMEI